MQKLLFRALPRLLYLLFTVSVAAQTFQSATVQTVIGIPSVMATADFSHDGRPDVVYQDSYTGGSLHVMVGNGDGTFHEVQQIALPLGIGAHITAADLNGDGFPDLVIGYDGFASNFTPAEFTVLLNRGDGTFGSPIFSPFPILDEPETAINDIAVADFNGDGFTDFIFTASEGAVLMKGDGTGHFAPQVLFGRGSDTLYDVYTGDFNGDGKPDIAINGIFGIYYALNTGGGTFARQTLFSILMNPPTGFSVADVNNDGHSDILFGANGSLRVAYSNGDGTFAAPVIVGGAPPPVYFAIIAVKDMNGDGLPDIITSNSAGPVVDLQDTSGKFSYTYQNGPAVGDLGLLAPVFADFDGDGIGDVVSAATGALVFSKGKADGTFNGAKAVVTQGAVLDIQPADFNKDGWLDAAMTVGGGSFYGALYVYAGDGAGNFAESGYVNNYPTYGGQSSIADFNRDGIPDVFNAGYILTSDGHGAFANSQLVAPPPNGSRPEGFTAIADFNEDGLPDPVTTTIPPSFPGTPTLSVALSSGPNSWTSEQISLPPGSFQSPSDSGPLVAADFNHDGHQDLATASTTSIYIINGDGKGNFILTQTLPIEYAAGSYGGIQSGWNDMEAADIDRDGNIDLLVPIADKNVIQIFYGRGDGTFEAPVSLLTAQDVRYVTVHDMDGDGIPDLILGGHALVRILHGLGHRTFESIPSSYAANPYSQKVRVADVNGDGNPDLLVPNGGYSSILEAGYTFTVLLNTSVPPGPPTATTLTCSPNPISISNSALLIAGVTSASGIPVGSIAFTDNGAALVTQPLVSGSTSLTYTGLIAGTHTLTATYVPMGSFATSSASCFEVVTALPTTSILSVNPTTASYGAAVQLTATISPTTPPGPSIPTGMVVFYSGTTAIGTSSLTNGVATLPLNSLPGGSYNLTCIYNGSSIYGTSTCNTVPIVINPAATTLTLSSSNNPASALTPVTFKAQFAVNGQSAGAGKSVAVSVNGQVINLTTDATGSAIYSISTLTPGSYLVNASFAATSSLLAYSAALTEVITAVPTNTSIIVTPNPAYFGQQVTMVATVSSQTMSTQVSSGSMTFFDGSTLLGTQPVTTSGTSTFTTSSLAIGSHSITATFNPLNTVLATSASPTVNEVILASGFTIALSPSTIRLPYGGAGSVTIQLGSLGNFVGPLALTYGTLPAYATASINPTTVTLTAGGTGPSTLTLNTVLRASSIIPVKPGLRKLPVVFTAFMLSLVPLSSWRRHKLTRLLGFALLFVALQVITGCTNAWYTENAVAPGTYQVPVTATDANHNSQTATLTVVITP